MQPLFRLGGYLHLRYFIRRGWEPLCAFRLHPYSHYLNHGAGGQYIYLVFKTTSDPKEAINGLNVFAGTRASGWPIQLGYFRIPQDLSQGAGGKYIYCCYTKTSHNPPIKGLCVIKGNSPHVYPPDESWVKITQDCNQGSGGSYIYICYSYAAPSITNITWAESPVKCTVYNLCIAIVGIKHIASRHVW